MATYLRAGSVFGIDIEFHWISIVFMLLFLAISLYSFFLLMLLVVSVLLHELSHSVTAIRNGVKVRKIILILPIGGLSVIDTVGLSPRQEFDISMAGPLSSLLIGSVFGAIVPFTPPGLATQVCQFLFEANVLLGLLNIMPAFPTDGGRIFRSLLEERMGTFKATMLTVKTSKVIIALLLVATLAYVMVIDATFAYKETMFIITLFTVFFLYSGASSEQEMTLIRRDAHGLTAGDVAGEGFAVVPSDTGVADLYRIVAKVRNHVLLTRDGDGYAFVSLLGRRRLQPAMTAADLAVSIPSVDARENVVDVLSVMESADVSIAAVVRGKRLVGIITYQNLQAFIALHVLRKKTTATRR